MERGAVDDDGGGGAENISTAIGNGSTILSSSGERERERAKSLSECGKGIQMRASSETMK